MKTQNIPANYKALGVETYNQMLTVNNCTQAGMGDDDVKKLLSKMKFNGIEYLKLNQITSIMRMADLKSVK